MKKNSLLILVLLNFFSLILFAQKDKKEDTTPAIDSSFTQMLKVLSELKYEPAGTKIDLDKMGQLTVPKGFKFVNAKQSEDVLTKVWGNPPGNRPLGMLFPENGSPLDSLNGWAFVIRYDGSGHIKDDDADEVNYDDLLEDMQNDTKESNKQRTEMGYGTVDLVGWASKPFYDKTLKTLHWAKELKFQGETTNTLNYDVRILGRKGLFSLNAVGGMKDLATIKPQINEVIAAVKFTEGNSYFDFNPDIDEVAALGIGGLVAGKVLAKVGFLAIIAKFWKIVIAGFLVAGGAIKRFFTGRKEEEVEPTPSEPEPDTNSDESSTQS